MSREVELKFKLDDKKKLLEKLSDLGVDLSIPKKQHDWIYMRNGKLFSDLEVGEAVIRIRKEGDDTTTTIKKYVNGIKDRQEVECGISDASLFAEYLQMLGFKLLVEVEKERVIGHYHGANITVDSVNGLGDFSEIEVIARDDSVIGARKQVEDIAKTLGFDNLKQVNVPYDELMYERKKEQ